MPCWIYAYLYDFSEFVADLYLDILYDLCLVLLALSLFECSDLCNTWLTEFPLTYLSPWGLVWWLDDTLVEKNWLLITGLCYELATHPGVYAAFAHMCTLKRDKNSQEDKTNRIMEMMFLTFKIKDSFIR